MDGYSQKRTNQDGRVQTGKATLSGTSVWRPQSHYTMSRIECRINARRIRDVAPKSSYTPPPPPKSRCRTFLRLPPSHFPLIRSRQGAKGVSRRAGGGYRGTLGFRFFRKRIALSQLQSHQSRYSVQPRTYPFESHPV